MIIKIIIIIGSIIANLAFNKVFVFKNDLAEYNLSRDGCNFDKDEEFNKFLEEKNIINNFLKKP